MSLIRIGRRERRAAASAVTASSFGEAEAASSELVLTCADSPQDCVHARATVGSSLEQWWRLRRDAAQCWSPRRCPEPPMISVHLVNSPFVDGAAPARGARVPVTVVTGPHPGGSALRAPAARQRACVLVAESAHAALDGLLLPVVAPGFLGWALSDLRSVLGPGRVGELVGWSGSPEAPRELSDAIARAEALLLTIRANRETTLQEVSDFVESVRARARDDADIVCWSGVDEAGPAGWIVTAIRG